jgi:hypothetical protein
MRRNLKALIVWAPSHQLPRTMNVKPTPKNAAVVSEYAKILGCSETEFLNRYLELKLDPLDAGYDYPTAEVMERCFMQSTFKSREKAQRVARGGEKIRQIRRFENRIKSGPFSSINA